MRTRFFAEYAIDPDDLKDDVSRVNLLSSAQLDSLRDFLAGGERLIQRDEVIGKALSDFLTKNSISGEAFARARRLALFVVQAYGKYGESVEDLVTDLASVASPSNEVTQFLIGLSGSISSASRRLKREEISRAGISSLTGISYVCDIHVDFGETDYFGDAASSRPRAPIDWVPVVVIRLSTDDNKNFTVQMDPTNLGRVLHAMQQARVDLGLLEQEIEKKLIGTKS